MWHAVGMQLRKPSGAWGRLTGRAMALINARPNALAIEALRPADGETILEIGCGPGLALQELLRRPELARAIGIDWSPIMLAQAAQRNREALGSQRLSLLRGDFARLPLRDETTDGVLAVNVVYFMQKLDAVRECYRVLRTGGRITLYATAESAMRNWPFASQDTHRWFDRENLAGLLTNAGFAREQTRIEEVDAGFGVAGLLAVAHKS